MIRKRTHRLRKLLHRFRGESVAREIKHFVIVRFNVEGEFCSRQEASGQKLNLDPDWLEDRFRLFSTYCLPSLQNQRDKNFVLVLLLDEKTPSAYRERLRRLCGGLTLEIVETSTDDFVDKLRAHLNRSRKGHTLATTRLDSDDALAPTFMEHLREYVSRATRSGIFGAGRFYFSFAWGQCYMHETGAYARRRFRLNAFGTLVEPPQSSLRTVYAHEHTEMMKRYDSILVESLPAQWCYVVHGGNLRNRFKGDPVEVPDFRIVPRTAPGGEPQSVPEDEPPSAVTP